MDLGGTRSVGILLSAAGRPVDRVEGEGVAWLDDPSGSEASLRSVVETLLGRAQTTPRQVVGACIGSAGADRVSVTRSIEHALAQVLPSARVRVMTDVALGLPAAGLESGVVIVAGTGAIAWGRNDAGTTARAGGWGYMLGDEGSGYDVGRQALQAALMAADGRGEGTLLLPRLIRQLRLGTIEQAVEWAHDAANPRRAIAALAALVVEVAHQGDQVAGGILTRAGIELGRSAAAVIRRLGLGGQPVMLVPIGGLFSAGDLVLAPLLRVAGREAPVSLRLPEVEPALAAARLVMPSLPEMS
jgi:N-acetylglucosamine kinase-like BadF-type ATPase